MVRNGYKDPRITVRCHGCGIQFDTPKRAAHWTRQPARFCSLYCRDYVAHNREWWCTWTPPKVVTAKAKPTRATWIAGNCNECGDAWVKPNDGQRTLYCSTRCVRRVNKRRRQAREHNASGQYRYIQIMRMYMADSKRCAYCRQQFEGLPDPEHVLPLSRGGRNDITNLVAACRACNTDKGDLTPGEWTRDRERRGLCPVDTDFTHQQFKHLVWRLPTAPAYRRRLDTVGRRTYPGTTP